MGRSVRDLSSAFAGSDVPPAILAAQAEAERQRQIMAVLEREKEVFARMQRESAQFRHKEHYWCSLFFRQLIHCLASAPYTLYYRNNLI